jgi:23S rRNA pseudouridine1911/1915/1917 synthase
VWYAVRVTEKDAGSFKAGDDQVGERLDRALQQALPELSRTAVQRLIDSGGVRVDGKTVRSGYRLRGSEAVEWTLAEAQPAPDHQQPEAIPLDVVREDADLLVIDKPRGLVVHPAPGHRSGTLVNAVLAHAGDDLSGVGGVERPGIVHRLDKDTSGLMVVAKSDRAYRSLQSQIQERRAERRYLALVQGNPRFERAAVDAPIGRHPVDRKKMGVIQRGSPHAHREARTDLRVLERFPGLTLLEARLQTGRTHQIRVHCAYIRLPVLGDETYGARHAERDLSREARGALQGLAGQALHAYRLSFDHPATGERLQFLSKPPPDFQSLLDALGSAWIPEENDPWPEEPSTPAL